MRDYILPSLRDVSTFVLDKVSKVLVVKHIYRFFKIMNTFSCWLGSGSLRPKVSSRPRIRDQHIHMLIIINLSKRLQTVSTVIVWIQISIQLLNSERKNNSSVRFYLRLLLTLCNSFMCHVEDNDRSIIIITLSPRNMLIGRMNVNLMVVISDR